jgi:hypothetical protein
MLLALRSGIGNQGSDIEPLGLPKYGACDVDRVIEGKLVDDLDRRVVGPGKPVRKLGTGRYFNIPLQPPYYLSKHPDLGLGVPAGYQQVSRVPQRTLAAFGRPPRNCGIQFLQKRHCLQFA